MFLATWSVSSALPSRVKATEVENCGRQYDIKSGMAEQAALIKLLVSDLGPRGNCIGGVMGRLGIERRDVGQGTLIALVDEDDAKQVHDPFRQAGNIYLIVRSGVYYQDQFDGEFYRVSDGKPLPPP